MDYLYANFGGLQQGAGDLGTTHTDLVSTLDTLASDTQLESWCSANGAKDEFAMFKLHWGQRSEELKNWLHRQGTSTMDVHDVLFSADRLAATIWHGSGLSA